MAEYPRRDNFTGMLRGVSMRANRCRLWESRELIPCCYLVARWILVWTLESESVCITHSPENHAPTFKPKESVA